MQVAEGGAEENNHERIGVGRFFEEMGGVRPGPFPPSPLTNRDFSTVVATTFFFLVGAPRP